MMLRRFLTSFAGVKHLAQRVASGEAVEDKAGRHKPPRDGVKPNRLLIHQMWGLPSTAFPGISSMFSFFGS